MGGLAMAENQNGVSEIIEQAKRNEYARGYVDGYAEAQTEIVRRILGSPTATLPGDADEVDVPPIEMWRSVGHEDVTF